MATIIIRMIDNAATMSLGEILHYYCESYSHSGVRVCSYENMELSNKNGILYKIS